MFYSRRINEHLYIITENEPGENVIFCMQLVVGEKKAILIDSGLKKSAELPALIREITDLPVELYLTHGHLDHVGNVGWFEKVHVGYEDAKMLDEEISYIPLMHGEKIDLGGRILEAYALSGHTDGSFCFLNEYDGYALTGDIINQEAWLCWDSCDTPWQYSKKVKVFYKKLKKMGIGTIFEGHTTEPIPSEICLDMIVALEEIMQGCITTDRMHHVENQKIKNQHSYGKSTIIYDKEKIKNEIIRREMKK